MRRSIDREAYIIGYEAGLKKEVSNYEEAWDECHFPDNQKVTFISFYKTGYKEGYSKRIELEQKAIEKLKEIPLDDEREIFDKYLKQLIESYFGASHLFNSWTERVTNELFPQEEIDNNELMEIQGSILDFAKNGNTQKTLRYLKVISIREPNAFIYYQALSIDTELMKMRFEAKKRKVDRTSMRINRQKIDANIYELIKVLTSKYNS